MEQPDRNITLTQEERELNDRADALYEFVARYYDYAAEKKDYGTGEEVCMSEAHMLTHIVNEPGITVSRLAKEYKRTKSFVSQTVKKLLTMGFITREAALGDARVVHLYPTERGIALNKAHMLYDLAEVRETFAELSETCTKADLDTFFRVIEAYRRVLE